MPSGFTKSDPIYGIRDLDDEFLNDSDILNKSTSGNMYTWGFDTYNSGFLGLGTFGTVSTPTQIGSGNNWELIARGSQHGAAIKNDGTLWTWGVNSTGALGTGNTTWTSSPVQVGTDGNWRDIACGYLFTTALKTDGTIWSWGQNNVGQLALGDTVDRSSPTQIGSLTNWKKLCIDGVGRGLYALKTDGTLWGSGQNYDYGLNTGDALDRSSPVQIMPDTDWKMVSGNGTQWKAIKINGTMWLGGTYVNSGIPDFFGTTTPVQIGTDNNWKHVAEFYRIKTNGTAWFPNIGLQQLGNSSNWKKIVGTNDNFAGIRTDGTLWLWGSLTGGSSTPVQWGTSTSWIDVKDGNSGSFLALAST